MSGIFKGKTIVTTGGTIGIGLELIREFLELGVANVAVLDLDDANNTVGGLQKEFSNQRVIYLQTDVTIKEDVKSAFRQVKDTFGTIDVVIGNAGIFDETKPEKVIAVNLIGVIHSTYEAIDYMSLKYGGKGGLIVNISSVSGVDTFYSVPSYAASKHGVVGLMRCLGTDFYEKLHGIKFITLCPGYTESQMFSSVSQHLPWGIGSDEVELCIENRPPQTAKEYAKIAVKVLEEEKNGSIWIIDGNKRMEVELKPHFKTY